MLLAVREAGRPSTSFFIVYFYEPRDGQRALVCRGILARCHLGDNMSEGLPQYGTRTPLAAAVLPYSSARLEKLELNSVRHARSTALATLSSRIVGLPLTSRAVWSWRHKGLGGHRSFSTATRIAVGGPGRNVPVTLSLFTFEGLWCSPSRRPRPVGS